MPTPIPERLTIPIGAPDSEAVSLFVETGQRVLKYQKLASSDSSAEGHVSMPVHAPTSGVVTLIDSAEPADHKQQHQLCVHLAADGADEALDLQGSADFTHMSSQKLIGKIRDAGIIGMGGAGFPTGDKLGSAADRGIELLIINAAECEPYITADEALIRERAKQSLLGAEILMRACEAPRCVIAIEDSKPDAIAALEKALEIDTLKGIKCTVLVVPGKYPTGSEKQLIHTVTGIEIPANQLPAQSGILMQNIGSAYAAYEAVVEGKPCISRITTLCGETLKTPKNFETLIGTRVSFLFELCGIDESAHRFSIVGGSLMGRQLASDDAVVWKTTNCLIAAGAEEFPSIAEEQACIRCGLCADACPVKLLPQQLLTYSKTANTSALLDHSLFDCIECGACDYVCPSHIPLVSIYKQSKEVIESHRADVARSEHWQQRFQQHQYRLNRDKDLAYARKEAKQTPSPEVEREKAAPAIPTEAEFFSKEKASAEIAAAVARVKARRNAGGSNRIATDKDESSK